MACACKNNSNAKQNNFVVKRTPIRHGSATRTRTTTGRRIIRREML